MSQIRAEVRLIDMKNHGTTTGQSIHEKKANTGLEEAHWGMLQVLGEDLALYVLSCLEPKHLAQCTVLSSKFHKLAADDRLWELHCDELWQDKMRILPRALDLDIPRLEAYRLSLLDGRRTLMTIQDLCANFWWCSFHQSAGDYYVSMDPYWKGLPPMQRFFGADGVLSAGPGDLMYGGRTFPWTLDLRDGAAFVSVDPFPELGPAQRRPDWGWSMQNGWVLYLTDPAPASPLRPALPGQALGASTRRWSRRLREGGPLRPTPRPAAEERPRPLSWHLGCCPPTQEEGAK